MMKKFSLSIIFFLLFISLRAESFYLSSGGNNSDGKSWSSAWTELNQVDWETVGKGGTLYIAAGTYKTCFPIVKISGITIKRATVSDHGSSKGWKKSMDGQITVDHCPGIFLEVRGVDGFTIDGTSNNPWKFKQIGITGVGGQIMLRNSKNVTIRNIELDGNSEKTLDGGPEDGLRVNYCDNLLVEHCYIHDFRQHSVPKAAHEDAVQMPSGNHPVFRYNIFANCGMLLFLGDPVWNDQWVNDITIEHNLFYCDSGIGRGTYCGIDLKGTNRFGTDTTRIENNTFILRSNEQARQCLYFSRAGKSNPSLTYFRNNIIYNSTPGDVDKTPFHSHNCYFNPLLQSPLPDEIGIIKSDPLFVDPERKDFHLQLASPCIDAGTNVRWKSDFDGKKITGLPDIGCFEFSRKR